MNTRCWDILRGVVTLILLVAVVIFLWHGKAPGELLVLLGIVVRSLFPTHTAKEPEKPSGVVR